MVKIRFLGACQEVGRSGVLIESEETGDSILCDYGTKTDYTQLFPEHVSGKDLSAIVLTHSHIDHCGGIPLFYISGSVPLFCTELTYQVSEILLQDMFKISQDYLPFGRNELYKMRKYVNYLDYGKRRRVGKKSFITLFNAGHIPGSALILIEMDGKKILYTGDINTIKTQLLNPANPEEIPPLDAIITETTYGTTDHSSRAEIEDKFMEEIHRVMEIKGIALVPAFGVSRSQEMLMVLNRDGSSSFHVTVDGMARKIATIYQRHQKMFRDGTALDQAIRASHMINQRRRDFERKKAATSPGVIVAPSGMLKGGTARYYAENIIEDPKNSFNLVSYQAEDTPGRYLLDHGKFIKNSPEDAIDVQAKVNHFDFSSHSGKSDLIAYLNQLKFTGEKKVFCVHGESEVLLAFAKEIQELGYTTETPLMGQVFTL
ncbi:Ribonuclease J [Candidatus Lokiarchaeum ossiferum]|uniref:Ribonuclease J n=1 Tax=Candidatus Lokiarchaeum ossiferum TaxID=2951803 RepID=A0ABY6HSI3_9ARCH|nr:Ribonuclease J [Candidatus Lokiarchaeum sp. B-35]